jgi:hypothetical protein
LIWAGRTDWWVGVYLAEGSTGGDPGLTVGPTNGTREIGPEVVSTVIGAQKDQL